MNSILSRVPLLCESLVLGRPMPARDAVDLALSSPDGAYLWQSLIMLDVLAVWLFWTRGARPKAVAV